MEERKGVYRALVGNPVGKRRLSRPRRRWGDNIKTIFKKWDGGMDWNDLAQNRAFLNAVMNLRLP